MEGGKGKRGRGGRKGEKDREEGKRVEGRVRRVECKEGQRLLHCMKSTHHRQLFLSIKENREYERTDNTGCHGKVRVDHSSGLSISSCQYSVETRPKQPQEKCAYVYVCMDT